MNIVVTESEYKKAKSVFSTTGTNIKCIPVSDDENVLAEKIISLQAKHAIIGTKKYIGPLYEALPRGGVIARFGIAYDGIDKDKLKEAFLYCTNTPDVLSHSVAELTIALMLICARYLADVNESIKNDQWRPILGMELMNKTLAVIGCGAIGSRVARIASLGMQMNVIGYDIRDLDIDKMKREYGFRSFVNNFENAVHNADYVSLHIPLMESTKYFVNLKRLNMIPDKAWLINTSRGAVINEIDLFKALKSGYIAGAALDVFINEPYKPFDKKYDLRLLNNVVFTPHIGSATKEASRRIAERCLRNIELAEMGEFEKMDIVAGP